MEKWNTEFLKSKLNITKLTEPYYFFDDIFIDTVTGAIFWEKEKPLINYMYEYLYWNPCLKGKQLSDETEKSIAIEKKRETLVSDLSGITDNDLNNATEISSDKTLIHLLHPFNFYAFGHFHDSLQRLYPLKDFNKESFLIVASDESRIVDFHSHFEALGYKKEQVIEYKSWNSRLIKAKKLIFPIQDGCYTTYTDRSYKWLIEKYEEYYGLDKTNRIPGIYCTRNHVSPGKRCVLNEDDVFNELRKLGFQMVTGNESPKEIAQLFISAKNVIALHGSVLANTIFSQEDSNIIELYPSKFKSTIDRSFLVKNKRAEKFNQYIIESDENFNIKIDIDFIKEKIVF